MNKQSKIEAIKPMTGPELDNLVIDLNQYGEWHVSKRGDIISKNLNYHIRAEQLEELDWVLHISEKENFTDIGDFLRAYFRAFELKDKKYITIQTYYKKREYKEYK